MFQEVINFWFNEVGPKGWWKKDDQFDQLVIKKYSKLHSKAVKCELYKWRESPEGRLAEIIILDQFSRNMFRDSPLSFAFDSVALALSQEAVSLGADQALEPSYRSFLYMPFMHSESMEIHKIAMKLFEKNTVESSFEFEKKHKAIIEKYGRYPHRNKILRRESTDEEIEFLKLPNSGF